MEKAKAPLSPEVKAALAIVARRVTEFCMAYQGTWPAEIDKLVARNRELLHNMSDAEVVDGATRSADEKLRFSQVTLEASINIATNQIENPVESGETN